MTVDADAPNSPSAAEEFDPADVGRAHRATESLHSQIYFAEDAAEVLVATGLRPGRMPYFASRAAPMGEVGPGTVAATFYNFNPSLVERFIPRAWVLASAEQVLTARFEAADVTLRRLLGDEVVASAEVAELAGLLREAAAGCAPEGRPLYAAHADLEWPSAPHVAMWHGITLLREHRGDGHTIALMAEGIGGVEAHLLQARVLGVTDAQYGRASHLSPARFGAVVDGLVTRGLLDADGRLTEVGRAARDRAEATTDRLAEPPYDALTAAELEKLVTDLTPIAAPIKALLPW